jgi:hypothetical protein
MFREDGCRAGELLGATGTKDVVDATVAPLGPCRLDQVVEERSLRLPQAGPVE